MNPWAPMTHSRAVETYVLGVPDDCSSGPLMLNAATDYFTTRFSGFAKISEARASVFAPDPLERPTVGVVELPRGARAGIDSILAPV